jgi:hypothetical protein
MFFFSHPKVTKTFVTPRPQKKAGDDSESISTGAQYVTLDNKIKCLSLAVFVLGTPPIKL